MRAARVDRPQAEIVSALRQAGAIITHLHKVGEGCPDLLVGAPGIFGLLELKDGKQPAWERKKTPAQIKWFDANAKCGPTGIATDVESALRFYYSLRDEALNEARRIYRQSPSKLDAKKLLEVFANAPDCVETSGLKEMR